MEISKEVLETVINASVEAGKAIMDIYDNGDFGVEMKSDNSPLTLADKAAHAVIMDYLQETQIPVLSEEGKHAPFKERKEWDRLWIVDPLDGTKEFVKKTGEFTVNIALVENSYPVLGVVFVPAKGGLYFGGSGSGSYRITLSDTWRLEEVADVVKDAEQISANGTNDILKIVASVSHLSKETEEFAGLLKEEFGNAEFLSVGSSIKICKVAEGSADIYPRLGPTMEWDTAAGQAIAEGAGACFINWKTKERFDYNRENLLNDWFVVYGQKFSVQQMKDLISR